MELFGLIAGVALLYIVWKTIHTNSAKHLQASIEMLCASANTEATKYFDTSSKDLDAKKIKEIKTKASSLLD